MRNPSRDERFVSASNSSYKPRSPRGYEPTEITYPANCIYLATDKGERRRSGSYYTPDHIVEYIVERALGKKCTDVDHQLTSEIREKSEPRCPQPQVQLERN